MFFFLQDEMYRFSKTFVNRMRQSLVDVMESKRKLNRKRKIGSASKSATVVESHGAKHRKTVKKDNVEGQDKTIGLDSKSVLPIQHGKETSCLAFLKQNQTIAVQGKVQLQAIKGTVDILGHTIKPNPHNYKLFSPKSSSLLTLKECSKSDDQKEDSETKLKLSDVLRSQSAKLKKIALGRADKAYSVLLMNGLQSLDTKFVCQYKEYEDIFSCTKVDKDCDSKSPEQCINEVTAPSGYDLVEVDNKYPVYKQPDEWNNIITDIKQAIVNADNGHRNPVILICGSKGVGKSTFARFAINSLLNSCKEVSYLECDVGQTELSPPSILSLSCITAPLLGPPFTHLQWPERAYFYGDISPKDNPNFYINSISSLYKYYKETMTSKPLVINTQGWVKGLGLLLLMDVIHITKPTHIIQINSPHQPTKNLPTITREFLDTSPGWLWPTCDNGQNTSRGSLLGDLVRDIRQTDGSNSDSIEVSDVVHHEQQSYPSVYQLEACTEDDTKSSSTFRSSDYRTMTLLAYFSDVIESTNNTTLPTDSLSLIDCTPYRVPWSHVAIHVSHTTVPRSQLLASLNASIVGLAVSPLSIIETYDDSNGFPKFLNETPIVECVGLGIVRNIDPVNRLFYILTPVPLDQLKRVNTLLKGNLEIPAPLLLKDGRPGVPYVSSEFSYDITGAGARKVRYNLQRKKFNSPARPGV